MTTFSLLGYEVPRKVHASACSGIIALTERIVALTVVFPLRDQILPPRYSMGAHNCVHTEPVCGSFMPLQLCTPYTMQERRARKLGHQYYCIIQGGKEKSNHSPATIIDMQKMRTLPTWLVHRVQTRRVSYWLSPPPPPSIVFSTSTLPPSM